LTYTTATKKVALQLLQEQVVLQHLRIKLNYKGTSAGKRVLGLVDQEKKKEAFELAKACVEQDVGPHSLEVLGNAYFVSSFPLLIFACT